MLIYNTTFQVDDAIHDNFLIWIKEFYIPEVQKTRYIESAAHLPDSESSGRWKCLFSAMGSGKQRIAASLAFGTGSAFE